MTERCLVLIDFVPHTRGGHFGRWLTWFARECGRRFDHIVIMTPDLELTASLFLGAPSADLEFMKIPEAKRSYSRLRGWFGSAERRGKATLRDILEFAAARHPRARTCGLVMWGFDLLDHPAQEYPARHTWATLAASSWSCRGFRHPSADRERQLIRVCEEEGNCAALLLLDQYAMPVGSKKAVFAPDLEDIGLSEEALAWAGRIRAFIAGEFSVALVGMLTGYRGVHEVVRLAGLNPDIRFVMAGKLERETIAPKALATIESGGLGNLMVIPEFLPEDRLNAVIHAVDSVFIDGANYPVQSSVVIRALHFGKHILTPEANSWTRDVIREFGVGLSYADSEPDIRRHWSEWRPNGSGLSRRAAAEMVSPEKVNRCFDEVAARLAAGRR